MKFKTTQSLVNVKITANDSALITQTPWFSLTNIWVQIIITQALENVYFQNVV